MQPAVIKQPLSVTSDDATSGCLYGKEVHAKSMWHDFWCVEVNEPRGNCTEPYIAVNSFDFVPYCNYFAHVFSYSCTVLPSPHHREGGISGIDS